MKTISLREPLKVKRITRAGKPVQVNGHPLWIIQPAEPLCDEEQRRREIEELFAEVRRGPR